MTGEAWNTTDPLRPWALIDDDAVRVIPIDVSQWLTDMGSAYGSHTVAAAAPLAVVSPGVFNAGVIPVKISVTSADAVHGKKYPFTLKIVGSDGQKDERTLWLKVLER